MMDTATLIKRAQEGDQSAKDRLVQDNMGLIWSVVKRFTHRGYETEDLFQIGSIGLIKCIDRFDLRYQVQFSTYAVPMIMGEIRRFLRDDGLIKVSRSMKETALKAKYMEAALLQQTGKAPTIDELAAALETDAEDLVMAMESRLEVGSLYQTVYQGDGSPVYLIDKLDAVAGQDDTMIDMIALKQIINRLDEKERQVIVLRYFKDRTQAQVARTIGVSQVQVSRIEKKVLQSIKEQLQGNE